MCNLKKPLNPRQRFGLKQNDAEMVKQDAVSDTKNKTGDVTIADDAGRTAQLFQTIKITRWSRKIEFGKRARASLVGHNRPTTLTDSPSYLNRS